MMQTTHPDSVNARRTLLGPYKLVAAPVSPKNLPPQRQDVQTLIDVVGAITTKEDRRKVEKIKTGVARNAGVFILDTWNQKTGKIASLAIPEASAGYKDCCKKKTKEEKAIRLAQLLNSNNVRRPAGDIRSVYRQMKQHDFVMVTSLVIGDLATALKYNLDAKSPLISFGSWWELNKDALKNMTNKQQ